MNMSASQATKSASRSIYAFMEKNRLFSIAFAMLLGTWLYIEVRPARDPVQVTYCLARTHGPGERQCIEHKTLRIPASYYFAAAAGQNPHPTEANPQQKIEVAYPSMQPWSTVPWIERWNTHKIEITLLRVVGSVAKSRLETAFLGTPKPVRLESLYGVDQYMEDGWGKNQLLVRSNADPQIFIRCAYSGLPAHETRFGCRSDTNTTWKLHMSYSHKRVLLPHWEDVQTRVLHLTESFVITP
ncbi:MAG: hypothetical protein RLZZ573_1809 [Pseudomonadota bacterium]|jgi:hypothetical protein